MQQEDSGNSTEDKNKFGRFLSKLKSLFLPKKGQFPISKELEENLTDNQIMEDKNLKDGDSTAIN